MYAIVETEVLNRYVSDYWTEDERAAFARLDCGTL